jgi:hypothetical protein
MSEWNVMIVAYQTNAQNVFVRSNFYLSDTYPISISPSYFSSLRENNIQKLSNTNEKWQIKKVAFRRK